MAGEAAINKVSDTFVDLADSAKLASEELYKVAGKSVEMAGKQASTYQKFAAVFKAMVDPVINLTATFGGLADAVASMASVIPGVKQLGSALGQLRPVILELASITSSATRTISDVAVNLLKMGSAIATNQGVLALASATGTVAGAAFEKLRTITGILTSQMAKLAPNLSKALGQGVEGASKGLAMVAEQGKNVGRALMGLVQTVGKMVGEALQATASIASLAASITSFVAKGINGFVSGMLSLPGKIGPSLTSALSSLAGPMLAPITGLIQGALNPMRALADTISPFIGAMNPGILEQLNFAFNDLNAVIGRALTPILGALTPIVRTFADALVPVSTALLPVFDTFAKVMVNLATGIIPIFSGLMVAMIPSIQGLANQFVAVTSQFATAIIPVVDALVPVFTGLFDSLVPLVPAIAGLGSAVLAFVTPILNWAVPKLTSAIQSLVSVMVEAINWWRGLIGRAAISIGGDPNQQNFQPQNFQLQGANQGASMNASTKSASFVGVSDLGSNLQAAAFGAGETPEMKTAENTAKMVEGINALVQGMARQLNQGQAFKGNQAAPGVR